MHELVPGESAEVREWRIDMLAHDSMMHEWDRMDASFKANGEHLELILSVHKQATEEWLNCWEGTWKTIFTEALSEIHQHAFTSRTATTKRSYAMRVATPGATGPTSTLKPETMCWRTAQKP